MRDEYDMSGAQRGAILPAAGKTRVTLLIDDVVLEALRQRAEAQGIGYQTLINDTLKQSLVPDAAPVNAQTLRRILREELERTA